MDYFAIGNIVKTQGLQGYVRVIPTTDDPTRFSLLDEVSLFFPIGSPQTNRTYQIEHVRYHNQYVVLKFVSVNTIEDAEKLKGATIKIPPEKALPLAEGEYYLRDLYDLSVETIEGEQLGTLTDILHTGANDVYVVTDTNGTTLMIPAIKQCITKVDLTQGKMIVTLLNGLRG